MNGLYKALNLGRCSSMQLGTGPVATTTAEGQCHLNSLGNEWCERSGIDSGERSLGLHNMHGSQVAIQLFKYTWKQRRSQSPKETIVDTLRICFHMGCKRCTIKKKNKKNTMDFSTRKVLYQN